MSSYSLDYQLENFNSFKYDMFLLEDMFEQIKMEIHINESIMLLSESTTLESLRLVQEAATDKMKNIFVRLGEMIAALWAKFVERVNNFVKSDKGYLERYKDIILKRKLKDDKYIMYPYWRGIDKLLSSTVPKFNYTSLKEHLASDEDFIKYAFGEFAGNEKVDFAEQAKTIFRGSAKQEEIGSAQINMTDLYNFCMDYAALSKKLEVDMKQIETAGNEAIKIISKMPTTKQSETTNETYIYSYTKHCIITEAENEENKDEGKKAPLVQKASSSTNQDGTTKPSAAIKNVADGEKEESDQLKNSITNSTEDLDRIKRYTRLCYKFLGAKMTVLQEARDSYMFIIKDHVKSHVGETKDERKENTKEKEEGTKYNNPTPEEQNKQGGEATVGNVKEKTQGGGVRLLNSVKEKIFRGTSKNKIQQK